MNLFSSNTIDREKCSVTDSEDLEIIYSVKDFPVKMGCTDRPQELDLKAEMLWAISKKSGLIQLKKLIPLDLLYSEQHGPGTVGKTWKLHHQEFAKFLIKHAFGNVLEIGGAHGILYVESQKIKELNWTILEPNPDPIKGCNARFIRGFFDEKFCSDRKYNSYVHSHVLEHLYNPREFMEILQRNAQVGDKQIFSIPNLYKQLKKFYTNAIMFEHTIFLTEPYIEYLLNQNNFEIIEKQYFMDDHSIFFATEKKNHVKTKPLSKDLYFENILIFNEYINYLKKSINDINNKIKNKKNIYLFGGHVFSQTLISYGLKTNFIKNILDNDPKKFNKRLYGTNLFVKSPQVLKDEVNPIVILRAGAYTNEIKKDIIENINRSTVFI